DSAHPRHYIAGGHSHQRWSMVQRYRGYISIEHDGAGIARNPYPHLSFFHHASAPLRFPGTIGREISSRSHPTLNFFEPANLAKVTLAASLRWHGNAGCPWI